MKTSCRVGKKHVAIGTQLISCAGADLGGVRDVRHILPEVRVAFRMGVGPPDAAEHEPAVEVVFGLGDAKPEPLIPARDVPAVGVAVEIRDFAEAECNGHVAVVFKFREPDPEEAPIAAGISMCCQ